VASKLGVAGKNSHSLFLRLDESQLVERIFVFERVGKFGSGEMSSSLDLGGLTGCHGHRSYRFSKKKRSGTGSMMLAINDLLPVRYRRSCARGGHL
jgi:hypothetical protein